MGQFWRWKAWSQFDSQIFSKIPTFRIFRELSLRSTIYYFTEFKLYSTLIIINFNIWRLIWEKEERLGLRRWLISALWNFKTCPKMGNGHAHIISAAICTADDDSSLRWSCHMTHGRSDSGFVRIYQTAFVGGIRTRVFIMIRITWFCKNKLIKIQLMILFCLYQNRISNYCFYFHTWLQRYFSKN